MNKSSRTIKIPLTPFRKLIIDGLDVTILLDHDIVDGAPAARFTKRLRELVENGLDRLS